MSDDKDKGGDAPFNMAMLFYFNLNKMIEKKDEAYLNNNLEDWYKGLNRIFTKIVFKISEGEEKELKIYFFSARYQLENKGALAVEILHKIDNKLIKLMNRYKMIFPKIEGGQGLEGLRKKYKLGGSDE